MTEQYKGEALAAAHEAAFGLAEAILPRWGAVGLRYNPGGRNMSSLISELPRPNTKSSNLYQRDGYSWALQQAEALRRRDLEQIDWDNVIEEIEGSARAERKAWVSHCARAIEHMLAIEYWESATVDELKYWRNGIGAFRSGMAAAIRANPGLQGEYKAMLAEAWANGRGDALRRLAEYSAEAAGDSDERPYLRSIRAMLPKECPYLVEHVAAFDPKRDTEPRGDVWPPAIAVRLNTVLDTGYEVLRRPQRSRGWSR